MSVYIDNLRAPYRGMVMCHMVADTSEELLAMADKIGVKRRWLQHAGTDHEHFDVSLTKRAAAVANGAIEVSQRKLVEVLIANRKRHEAAVFDAIEAAEANAIFTAEELSFGMMDWGD